MAILSQERHVLYVTGTLQNFVITSTMTSAVFPTELPHLFVFVMSLVSRNDPKDDTLARVARIADLTTLPLGRVAALASNSGTGFEYLEPTAVTKYTTLTEAISAQTAIKDRVNALITDWITFNADFNAPDPTPENITLPTVDPSQKDALIAAYKAAKEDRYDKGLVAVDAAAEQTDAQTLYTSLQADVTTIAGLQTTATQLLSDFSTAQLDYQTLYNAGTVYIAAASTSACAATFAAATTTFQAAVSYALGTKDPILTSQLATFTAFVSSIGTFYSAKSASSTAAAADVQSTTTANTVAQQDYADALVTEAAALAAVQAICPDFLGSSICNVPG